MLYYKGQIFFFFNKADITLVWEQTKNYEVRAQLQHLQN